MSKQFPTYQIIVKKDGQEIQVIYADTVVISSLLENPDSPSHAYSEIRAVTNKAEAFNDIAMFIWWAKLLGWHMSKLKLPEFLKEGLDKELIFLQELANATIAWHKAEKKETIIRKTFDRFRTFSIN